MGSSVASFLVWGGGGGGSPPNVSTEKNCNLYARASELRKFSHFHILKLLFPSIFCWYFVFVSETYIFRSQITSANYTINAVSFYYLWYGTLYTDKTLTLWKSMYMRASELRKCWHVYIIKVLFLSIWMGRNNHLQINILKHILRMHISMIFVGSKVFTHARYWQIKKYVCMIFPGGGGAPRICGGARAPPPVATPLGV